MSGVADTINSVLAKNIEALPSNALISRTFGDILSDIQNVKAFGAIGDGNSHPISGAVQSVTFTNNGSGYTSAPTVAFSTFEITGGATAAGTAIIGFGVASTSIAAGGSGYTSAPTVTFSSPQLNGGTSATGTANLTSGAVSSITITDAGSGYTSPPIISFSGGGGSGATATSTLSTAGGVFGIDMTTIGAGYTSAPTVTFSGGGGTGAAATANLTAGITQFAGNDTTGWTLAQWQGIFPLAQNLSDEIDLLAHEYVAALNYLNGGEVFIPSGLYVFNRTLDLPQAITLRGVGCAYQLTFNATPPNASSGTIFYFNHSGVGISATNASNIAFRKFGTYRNQPVPNSTSGVSWTPNANDFDIKINTNPTVDNVNWTYEDLLLINPTKGISIYGSGQHHFFRVRMQSFQVGIQADEITDTSSFSHIHNWPFWSENSNVVTYELANNDAFLLYRVDHPFFSNVFSFQARSGIHFAQSSNGTVSRMSATNLDFDGGVYALWIDSSVTDGIDAKIANLTCEPQNQYSQFNTDPPFYIQGDNVQIDFANVRCVAYPQSILEITGSNSFLDFVNLHAEYNGENGAYPFSSVAANNVVNISSMANLSAPNNGVFPIADPGPNVFYTSGPTFFSSGSGNIAATKAFIQISADFTLPSVFYDGREMLLINDAASPVTISTASTASGNFIYYAPNFSSATSITLAPYETVMLHDRGTGEYDVIGGSWAEHNLETATYLNNVEIQGAMTAASGTINGIVQGVSPSVITLATNPPVSGTAYQWAGPGTLKLSCPITLNPTSTAAATAALNIGPTSSLGNQMDYSSRPAGLTAADGEIETLKVQIPAGWYYGLIVVNATIGTCVAIAS